MYVEKKHFFSLVCPHFKAFFIYSMSKNPTAESTEFQAVGPRREILFSPYLVFGKILSYCIL